VDDLDKAVVKISCAPILHSQCDTDEGVTEHVDASVGSRAPGENKNGRGSAQILVNAVENASENGMGYSLYNSLISVERAPRVENATEQQMTDGTLIGRMGRARTLHFEILEEWPPHFSLVLTK